MSGSSSKYEYLLAFLLEPLPVGTKFVGWPLHITLIPSWIQLSNEEELINGVAAIAKQFRPFKAIGAERVQFGWGKKTTVTRVEAPDLHELHNTLLVIVRKHGFMLSNTKHMRADYKPHATRKKDKELKPGEQILVNRIEVFKAPIANPLTREKEVIAVLELGK